MRMTALKRNTVRYMIQLEIIKGGNEGDRVKEIH